MNLKKILLIIITVLFLASVPLAIFLVKQRQELRMKAAPASTLSFSPASLTAAVGQDFNLNVVIETQTNVVPAVELHLAFNPTVFEASNLAAGSNFPQIYDGPTIDNTAGTAYIVVGNVQSPIQGTGTVASITFHVIGPSSQVERITFASGTQAGAWQEEGANVLIGTNPASITITEETTTPTPTVTTTPGVATGTPTPTTTPGGTTATPTTTPVVSATGTPTPTPTSTPSPSTTPTPQPGATATPTSTPTSTPNPAATSTPTSTPRPTSTPGGPTPTPPVSGVSGPTFTFVALGLLLLIWGLVAFL